MRSRGRGRQELARLFFFFFLLLLFVCSIWKLLRALAAGTQAGLVPRGAVHVPTAVSLAFPSFPSGWKESRWRSKDREENERERAEERSIDGSRAIECFFPFRGELKHCCDSGVSVLVITYSSSGFERAIAGERRREEEDLKRRGEEKEERGSVCFFFCGASRAGKK